MQLIWQHWYIYIYIYIYIYQTGNVIYFIQCLSCSGHPQNIVFLQPGETVTFPFLLFFFSIDFKGQLILKVRWYLTSYVLSCNSFLCIVRKVQPWLKHSLKHTNNLDLIKREWRGFHIGNNVTVVCIFSVMRHFIYFKLRWRAREWSEIFLFWFYYLK